MTLNMLNELIAAAETDLTLELQFFQGDDLFGTSTLDLTVMAEESRPIVMQVKRCTTNFYS